MREWKHLCRSVSSAIFHVKHRLPKIWHLKQSCPVTFIVVAFTSRGTICCAYKKSDICEAWHYASEITLSIFSWGNLPWYPTVTPSLSVTEARQNAVSSRSIKWQVFHGKQQKKMEMFHWAHVRLKKGTVTLRGLQTQMRCRINAGAVGLLRKRDTHW